MSTSLSVKAYSGKNSPEFQKHYNAVKFCVENELSFPKETSEFFRGKVEGGDLEDYTPEYALEIIQDGVEVPLVSTAHFLGNEIRIKVSDIPSIVDEIVVRLS